MSIEIGAPADDNTRTPERPYRSYSAFTSWLRCGEAYRLERVANVPQVPALYLIAGSAIHEITESYDRELYETEGR